MTLFLSYRHPDGSAPTTEAYDDVPEEIVREIVKEFLDGETKGAHELDDGRAIQIEYGPVVMVRANTSKGLGGVSTPAGKIEVVREL